MHNAFLIKINNVLQLKQNISNVIILSVINMKYDFIGYEKISLVDFDGYLTATIFSNGCNYRCPFCHNAPLVLENAENSIFDEFLTHLKKRQRMLEAVCITGGEPTLVPDLKEKIRKIKEFSLLVKLDTNGTNPQILKELINENLLDYIAMDIKNSPTSYNITCGVNNPLLDNIKESMMLLMSSNIPYEFRTTLVDEFHDENSIKEIGMFLKGAKKLYLQKFVERDTCIKSGLHEVSKEKALKYQDLLKNYIEEVNLRGY